MRMKGELVHDRALAPAGAVRQPELADAPTRRSGAVYGRQRGVVPPRRQRDADHGDRVVDRLERVVRLRQHALVGAAGQTSAAAGELGLPEPGLVRLVAYANLLDRGI